MRIADNSEHVEPRQPPMVLFLGSGFSVAFGLPTTTNLSSMLLEEPNGIHAIPEIEGFVTKQIAEYWTRVFGWSSNKPKPALEDHFTQIDLAANFGHHLGSTYGPKELRAIRRMTIHRVFSTLKSSGFHVECVLRSFKTLYDRFDVSIVTTNWDTEAESSLELLEIPFNFGVDEITSAGRRSPRGGPVLKLHGSTNHGYCDTCRTLIHFGDQTVDAAVSQKLLLEPGDFRVFGAESLAKTLERIRYFETKRTCECGGRIGARVGTFSFRKDLNPHAFYTIWDKAQSALQMAQNWLFVGYSLPEADIEIRHMLKWTQLARKESSKPSIHVVLKDDCKAGERYRQFFGIADHQLFQCGFDQWTSEHLEEYCGCVSTQ